MLLYFLDSQSNFSLYWIFYSSGKKEQEAIQLDQVESIVFESKDQFWPNEQLFKRAQFQISVVHLSTKIRIEKLR